MQAKSKSKRAPKSAPAAIVAPIASGTTAPASAPVALAPLTTTAPAIAAPIAAPVADSVKRLSESDVSALYAILAPSVQSIPVKLGANRGRDSSEPLLAPHARVGGGARNYAAIIFAAIAQNIKIESGAIVPRFFTLRDTPLHVETGAGRNALRGRTDKKSGAVTLAVKLADCDSGDAFKLTDSAIAEFALIAPANIKAFASAIDKLR